MIRTKKSGGGYILASLNSKSKVFKPYANLVDIQTITHGARLEKYRYPVWVDIFPMDSAADNKSILQLKHKLCMVILMLAQRSMLPADCFGKKILHWIGQMVLKPSFRLLNWFAERKSNGEYLTNYFSVYGAKDISAISYYHDYTYMKFEGKKFRVPMEYDARLTQLYGNYMKLPPVEKRIPHVTEAYWIS